MHLSSTFRLAVCAGLLLVLAGCASAGSGGMGLYAHPEAAKVTSTRQDLIDLPDPAQPVSVAVFGFQDQTGQFAPSDTTQTLSRALSQGATSVLIQSLRETGHGRWFTVLEREHLDNLLKERQVITEMRQRYLGEKGVNPEALPSLLFAGVLLEGGVIGYDTNTLTGGAGARLLGIGGNVDYRQDTITVYLRAVATKTGEVLASVVARKTVVSAGVQGGAFRYVSYKNLLETEVGFTVNEPRTIALEQAVGKAAYDLILEGAKQGVWAFADKTAAAALINDYLAKQGDGRAPIPAAKPTALAKAAPAPATAPARPVAVAVSAAPRDAAVAAPALPQAAAPPAASPQAAPPQAVAAQAAPPQAAPPQAAPPPAPAPAAPSALARGNGFELQRLGLLRSSAAALTYDSASNATEPGA